jgi:hypothetical protein
LSWINFIIGLDPEMSKFARACHYALSDGIPWRSFWVALVVGTLLNLINQGDALYALSPVNWWKVAMTYMVPYLVSTYGAVSYRLSLPGN